MFLVHLKYRPCADPRRTPLVAQITGVPLRLKLCLFFRRISWLARNMIKRLLLRRPRRISTTEACRY